MGSPLFHTSSRSSDSSSAERRLIRDPFSFVFLRFSLRKSGGGWLLRGKDGWKGEVVLSLQVVIDGWYQKPFFPSWLRSFAVEIFPCPFPFFCFSFLVVIKRVSQNVQSPSCLCELQEFTWRTTILPPPQETNQYRVDILHS